MFLFPSLTSEEVGEGRVDAKELAEHLLWWAEDERKAAHNVEVIEIVCVVMVAGMRPALATFTQSILAVLVVDATLLLCGK